MLGIGLSRTCYHVYTAYSVISIFSDQVREIL